MKRDVQLQRAIEILKASRILDKTQADREGRLERPSPGRRPRRPGPRTPGPPGGLTTPRMLVLGIETSCDETAAAVLADGALRSSVVASQDPIHGRYGGVVPELASRRHLEVMLPVVARALDDARRAAAGPRRHRRDPRPRARRLAPRRAARWPRPSPTRTGSRWSGVNHLEGHIFAGRLADPTLELPFLALVVSGGHTALYALRGPAAATAWSGRRGTTPRARPSTRSPSSSGSAIRAAPSSSARRGRGTRRPSRSRSPRSGRRAGLLLQRAQDRGVPVRAPARARSTPDAVADVAASFQATAVKMLVRKAIRAARELGDPAHPAHRRRGGQRRAARGRSRPSAPSAATAGRRRPPRLCTDNAAMIAAAGPPGSRRASGPTSRSTPTRPSRSRDA